MFGGGKVIEELWTGIFENQIHKIGQRISQPNR